MKILYIVENAVDSGGNRVIFIKIKESIFEGNKVEVAFILRRINRLKDILGLVKDYLGMIIRYRGVKVKLISNPITTDGYDKVITTGRRCLEFLENISCGKHIHLIQHIEAWNTFNSKKFLQLSETKGYANPGDTLKCITQNEEPGEIAYLLRLKKIKSFLTVSNYLEKIIHELNPTANIEVKEPPEISFEYEKFIKTQKVQNRAFDVLIFIRGLKFKGDDLAVEIINELRRLNSKARVIVVISGKAKKINIDWEKLTFVVRPSDKEMAKIYASSKVLINPSLTEGYGAVPREALKFGCKCITSNTGWIQDYKFDDLNIIKVEKHSKVLYLEKIIKIIND